MARDDDVLVLVPGAGQVRKAELVKRIVALADLHGYATHREREISDALLKAALDALEGLPEEWGEGGHQDDGVARPSPGGSPT